MSVGLVVTKTELDQKAGDIARTFQRLFDDVVVLQGYFNATPDQDLEALGYTPQEVAVLKTTYLDLAQLGRIAAGVETLSSPKDFRTFARQLWGIGAF